MQLRKLTGKAIIWLTAAVFVLAGSVLAYADEYIEVKDGDISFVLPDGWVCNEIYDEDSEDSACEQIAEVYDETENSSLNMELYYARDEVDEYDWIYFRSDEDIYDAMEYFDKYGKTAVQDIYAERIWSQKLSIGEPELYEAEYCGFLVIPVNRVNDDGENLSEVVYLTCDMTNDEKEVIHKVLRFYNDDSSIAESQQEDIRLIADEFYDYGYGDDSSYDDDDYSSSYDDDFEVMSAILGFVTLVIPFAFVVFLMIRVSKKNASSTGGLGNKHSNSGNGGNTWNGWKRSDGAEKHKTVRKDDFSAGFLKKRKDDFSAGFRSKSSSFGEDRSGAAERTLHKQKQHPHDHIRPSNAEERYVESLRTLHKSGLLTREEMSDMLERHERNKMYRR